MWMLHDTKELGSKDITINSIRLGQDVFGRLGETEDITNIVELLVSDKARCIIGQTIRVNGGFN